MLETGFSTCVQSRRSFLHSTQPIVTCELKQSPIFSHAEIGSESQPEGAIGRHVHDFVAQLKHFHRAKIRTDLLDLCAKLSIDVVSDYLLGLPYGGLTEHAHLGLADRQKDEAKLSANAFVHAIVGFARFSLLPNWLFKIAYSVSQRLGHSEEVDKSLTKIAQFIDRVMALTKAAGTTSSEKKSRLHQCEEWMDLAAHPFANW
ncbi:hypothetical protein BKA66DRAFT_437401 [Pyrenochaeta sp. MPI-SDFR-AT-0127]|nr:hypothetical protein BKA66DRAFT_437401 [Pyrenochaeta sp. MPI-SDFR-AT-0127]